ncbi:unnamed protein product (macronuclear) [Paramecium tetraurelia]|uniref:Cyclic nucleotide-binding domain-containing protein n=1 Tax=Paramecium tetraurelia TaxID=5888 RepID=A0BS31_PARTE|nr:uncharacterized protein GSPATT00031579001 [Paramecium tetraurelia]CAK61348.1 unnamed protein product [Paramecium tetraurelia]|eukprot:XP_001428746.1 hypothetical protein (macronuclear) [Paramecium tetraurelia strain d4-2]
MFQFTDRQIQIPENKRKKSEISSLIHELTMDQKISLCVEILERNPEHRRPEDLQIIQAFTSKNKFLKQIQEEEGEGTLRECYKRMLIEFYDENQVVLEQGERAHQFFIILSGNVSVYVYRDPKVDVREEGLDKAALIKKRSFNTNKLISGESFGEMALLNDNLRSASIICDSKCIFGVLSKKDYKEILQKAHENRVNQQLKEFHGCMKQYNVSTKLLDILFTAFQSFHYQFRQTVYFQGQQSKQEIYLIKNGEFLITESNDNLFSPKKFVSNVALLQKGQFFGDHECFQNIEKRQQNVICNSENGVVLKIQLSSLIQRLCEMLVYRENKQDWKGNQDN